jgi:exosome complex component RRP42
MAPLAVTQVLLSPAELSYLHASLSSSPPLRPDGRSAKQFRPLIAEQDILPSTNGSARVCFADGTEAIVGIKAEVEKTNIVSGKDEVDEADDTAMEAVGDGEEETGAARPKGENAWVDMTIDIPGYRDDDALPVFLASMLTEALLASGELQSRLWINRRFHWKLYLDVSAVKYPQNWLLNCIGFTLISTIIISTPFVVNYNTLGVDFSTASSSCF